MCGIAGSVNTIWSKTPLDSINHRGPDNRSDYIFKNIFLGHTRLSIQDLSPMGNQPMVSNDGRFVITYNGELYNHWNVRKTLLSKGYKFESTSDTETLLYSWIEWGTECIKIFNGIFAFALFDKKQNKIYLVRDQFGIKPLYYFLKGNTFAFSSELKTFINMFDFDETLNMKSIINYVSFLWSPGEQTMYKYVRKLAPGNILEINTNSLSVKQTSFIKGNYFKGEYWECSEDEWIKKVDGQLNQAVENQLLSDAPLGFFLSGGLDSSLLVAIAKSQKPNDTIECFTIDQFKNSNLDGFTDDLPFAKAIANKLDLSLNIMDGRSDWVNEFDKMIWQLDEPQGDLAPINVSLISQLAKKMGIKVLLSGAGGDDIFSGYRRHQAMLFNKQLNFLPRNILRAISNLFRGISYSNSKIRRIKKLTRDWGKSELDQLVGFFNWLPSDDFIDELFSPNSLSLVNGYDPYNYFKEVLTNSSNLSLIDKILLLEQKTFLIDHNLNYTDKLSMASGVETRVPYLDFDLVELAGHIPQEYKIKNKETKYILKKVAEKYLPKEIIYRPKTGFGAPVKELINNDFQPLINSRLNNEKLLYDGIFNPLAIQKMIEENKNGRADNSYNILSLLSIQSWLSQFPWKLPN